MIIIFIFVFFHSALIFNDKSLKRKFNIQVYNTEYSFHFNNKNIFLTKSKRHTNHKCQIGIMKPNFLEYFVVYHYRRSRLIVLIELKKEEKKNLKKRNMFT